MFPLHEIPTFIKKKKHGKRYIVSLPLKKAIRLEKERNNTTQINLAKNYKLPITIIRRILKEQT